MSSAPSNPPSSRRSQRQVNRQSIARGTNDVGDDNALDAVPIRGEKKRKKDSNVNTGKIPICLLIEPRNTVFFFMWFWSSRFQAEGLGIQASLEEVGVSVGPKTCRQRLSELLDKYVTPKKPRLSHQKGRISSKKDSQVGKPPKLARALGESDPMTENEVNYAIYHESVLAEVLQAVGVDTRGLGKEALIKSCRIHSELSVSSLFFLIIIGEMRYCVANFSHYQLYYLGFYQQDSNQAFRSLKIVGPKGHSPSSIC